MRQSLVVFSLAAGIAAAQSSSPPDGKALFQTNCLACHSPSPENRAPLPEALANLSQAAIVNALETGAMKVQGSTLTPAQRVAIARFLSKDAGVRTTNATPNICPAGGSLNSLAGWNGWGVDLVNSRFQPAKAAGMTAQDVPKLKLAWAFGFPDTFNVFGQPTSAGGRLFFGSGDGTVYSLNAKTGCVYWTFKAATTVRTPITLGPLAKGGYAAYFGDGVANAYSVDAQTGELIWKIKIDDHKFAGITGGPALYNGRLYVPVRSGTEEMLAANPKYACCTFRGSLVALDAATGKQLWKTFTIPDPPTTTHKNKAGTDQYGPSGAAIWSAPTVDVKRKAIYAGTGNNYSDPVTKYSDAVLAFDLETGSLRWAKQLTPDVWNVSCAVPDKANCPEKPDGDTDIGTSPIIRTLPNGRDVIVVGQKSGVVHALDPEKRGDILWQTRIGKGSPLGGVMWGLAADNNVVYAPLSDVLVPDSAGGLYALRIASGEKVWYAPPVDPACKAKKGCSAAQMAPATLIEGAVFSGSMDGHLRAYSTADGKVVWDFDTLRDFDTVNGVKAHGGSMNATGPTIADGMLFVNSGYAQLTGMAGNVLLAFTKP
jgi:polyvinyl alcohol dehydrogenase (cytochrome)